MNKIPYRRNVRKRKLLIGGSVPRLGEQSDDEAALTSMTPETLMENLGQEKANSFYSGKNANLTINPTSVRSPKPGPLSHGLKLQEEAAGEDLAAQEKAAQLSNLAMDPSVNRGDPNEFPALAGGGNQEDKAGSAASTIPEDTGSVATNADKAFNAESPPVNKATVEKAGRNPAPTVGGGIGKGAATGASTGASFGSVIPGIGTVIGGAIGAVVGAIGGGITSGVKRKWHKRESAELDRQENLEDQMFAQDRLSEFDQEQGTGIESFEKGGILHYPYQDQDKGIMVNPTLKFGNYRKSRKRKLALGGSKAMLGEDEEENLIGALDKESLLGELQGGKETGLTTGKGQNIMDMADASKPATPKLGPTGTTLNQASGLNFGELNNQMALANLDANPATIQGLGANTELGLQGNAAIDAPSGDMSGSQAADAAGDVGGDVAGKGGKWSSNAMGAVSAGAGAVSTISDAAQAGNPRPSVGAGIGSGAGKGASMGAVAGPWGALIGGVVGGVAGGINSGTKQKWYDREQERQTQLEETKDQYNAQDRLAKYDQERGTGISSFEKGGMIHYPYQEQDEGNMIAPTIQLANGGNLKPISDTTVEVDGHNPGETDGVELETAFVDDGETIEGEKVYTDAFGRNGKKATKKNKSFADIHKKLQKSKNDNPRFEGFNAFIDKKSEKLFAEQESLKGPDGEPMKFAEGGKIPEIKEGETEALPMDLQFLLAEEEEGFAEAEMTPEAIELDKQQKAFDDRQEANPVYTDIPDTKPSPSTTAYTSNKDYKNRYYNDRMGDVNGVNLQDAYLKSAQQSGVDPTEFAAAMSQENWDSRTMQETLDAGAPINSYTYGLDTVGDYGNIIEQKLGEDYSPGSYDTFKSTNDRAGSQQAVRPAKFQDPQKMADTAAAIYKYRSEVAGQTAKDLGIELTPEQRQYFNYMAYNTQHNAPNQVVRGSSKKGDYNASLEMMMKDFKKKGLLDKKGADWDEAVRVKRDGVEDLSTSPYTDHDSGKGQLFKNAGHGYRRIADLEGAYTKGDKLDKPYKREKKADREPKIGPPLQYGGELHSFDKEVTPEQPKAVVVGLENGGYTDMNTLSAEHMKAGLSLRRKKKYAYGGYTDGGITPGPINERSMVLMNDVLSKRKKKKKANGGVVADTTAPTMVAPQPIAPAANAPVNDALAMTLQGDMSVQDYNQGTANANALAAQQGMADVKAGNVEGWTKPGYRGDTAADPNVSNKEYWANTKSDEILFDESAQLALGAIATAPLKAGASLVKQIARPGHGPSSATDTVKGAGHHQSAGHTAKEIIETGRKKSIYGSHGAGSSTSAVGGGHKFGGKLSYKKGGKLSYQKGGEEERRRLAEQIRAQDEAIYAEEEMAKLYGSPDVFTNKDKVIGTQGRADIGDITLDEVVADREEVAGVAPVVEKTTFGQNLGKVGSTLADYGADIAGLATRLPSARTPSGLSKTKLQRDNNKAEIAEIRRAARGASKSLEQTTQGAGQAASRGDILAKRLQAENVSHDQLRKTNMSIANQEAAINAQQDATNVKIGNQFKQDQLSQQLAQQRIQRESLVNLSNRFGVRQGEKKARELDERKLKILADTYKDSGQGSRSFEEQFENLMGRKMTAAEKKKGKKKYGGLMKKKAA